MSFLETITALDNDALVPINRIKYINCGYSDSYFIKIVSDDGDWEEYFGKDEKKCYARFEQIKNIVNGK